MIILWLSHKLYKIFLNSLPLKYALYKMPSSICLYHSCRFIYCPYRDVHYSILVDAIFGEFHPEYCQYLYLLIPVSVAFLNPIGFLMLEFQKSANEREKTNSNLNILWKAVKGVITNPLVFMVILGLVFHFVLNYTKEYTGFDRNHWFLSPFLSVIGSSFGATALFYLGLTLVGRTKEFDGFALLVPFLLVFCKRFGAFFKVYQHIHLILRWK